MMIIITSTWLYAHAMQESFLDKKNTVIVLNGTSSAGKSSIAHALQNAFYPEKIEVLSIDTVFYEVARKYIEEQGYDVDPNKNFTELCASLPETFEIDGDRLLPRAETELFERVKKYAQTDNYVIVDAVINNAKEAEKWTQVLETLSVYHILVYCAPNKLLERLMQRNHSNIVEEHRGLAQPFEQFFDMYRVQKQEALPIDEINVLELDDLIQNNIVKKEPMMQAEDQTEAQRALEVYKKKFLNTDAETIKIVPEDFIVFDCVVNSSILSSQECAQQIIEKLNLQ